MVEARDRAIEEDHPGYTPEEVALMARLRVFVTMRWVAVVGVVTATIVASRVFQISFSTLPIYIICAVIASYNLMLLRQLQNLERKRIRPIIPPRIIAPIIHFTIRMLEFP